MNGTKEKVLELLESRRGLDISGQEIAGTLGVTRSAVWKAIKQLKNDGYKIDAVTKRGYSLCSDNAALSVQGLLPYLDRSEYANDINIFTTLESTNKTAKEMAVKGCRHGTVVIAGEQTAGSGRNGKSFYSPADSGLYISFVLLERNLNLPNVTLITSAAAVAVCKAVKKVTGAETGIKWVNDVLLNGKKICGILTEAVTNIESGKIDWIVIGIGINVNTNSFPDDVSEVAASILNTENAGNIRSRIAAELINSFRSAESWINAPATYQEYKDRLVMLGKRITVMSGDCPYEATAADVDGAGHLIVKKDDGELVSLSSGEISIKL